MKFSAAFIEQLMMDKNTGLRFINSNDILFETQESAGEEAVGNVIRLAEDSNNPLEVHMTTSGNFRVYNKLGSMIKFFDTKFEHIKDIVSFLKKY